VPDPLNDLPQDRLKALEERLAKAKQAEDDSHHMKKDYAQANLAWRMVIELVAGLGIGFGMGYGLDYAFGTMPLFLVIFTFLGLAAGVKTMLASAKEIEKQQAAKAAMDEEDKRGD
jgi:ATP synthase protein I